MPKDTSTIYNVKNTRDIVYRKPDNGWINKKWSWDIMHKIAAKLKMNPKFVRMVMHKNLDFTQQNAKIQERFQKVLKDLKNLCLQFSVTEIFTLDAVLNYQNRFSSWYQGHVQKWTSWALWPLTGKMMPTFLYKHENKIVTEA